MHNPKDSPSRPAFALAAALALLVIVLPSALAYTPNVDAGGAEIEPNPRVQGNVTIGTHKLATCAEDPLCYEDDSGDVQSLEDHGFSLNSDDVAEPIRFYPSKVNCQYYGEDSTSETTKKKTSAWCANVSKSAWLDTGKWTRSGNEANDTWERVVRNGAHALHIKNPGVTPAVSDADTFVLDFEDLTTDYTKYRFILGVEFVGLTDTVDFVITDASGTGTERFRVSSLTADNAHVGNGIIANRTGTVFVDPLVSEGTTANGGMTTGIGKVHIEVNSESDAGATEFYVFALALQTKRFEFGEDEDGEPVYNATYVGCDGKKRTTPEGYACLASFAPSFDYETLVSGLRVSYELPASSLADEDVVIVASELKDSATYGWRANYRFGFTLPEMIDLTYEDQSVVYPLPVAGSQHDVMKACGTDKTKSHAKTRAGAVVSLASPTVGKECEVEFTVLYTDAQMEHVTEVGFLGLSEGHPASRAYLWLLGIPGVGLVIAGFRRRNRRIRGR